MERRRFGFNKLVRDKIPDRILKTGGKHKSRQLEGREYLTALRDKLIEEVAELEFKDKDEAASELADIKEVIDCIADELNITASEIQEAQKKKNNKSGSFKQGVFVEEITISNDDPWAEHFESNPDRYPELPSKN